MPKLQKNLLLQKNWVACLLCLPFKILGLAFCLECQDLKTNTAGLSLEGSTCLSCSLIKNIMALFVRNLCPLYEESCFSIGGKTSEVGGMNYASTSDSNFK